MYVHQTLRHQFNQIIDNISDGDIKGFVFQHNSNLWVQLSVFLIGFCWNL